MGEVFTRFAVTGSCGDLLYSGHTAHGMSLMLVILRYGPGLKVAKGLAISAMVLLALSLLAFKAHYSSDVVVAIYVTIMIWRLMPREAKRVDCAALRIEGSYYVACLSSSLISWSSASFASASSSPFSSLASASSQSAVTAPEEGQQVEVHIQQQQQQDDGIDKHRNSWRRRTDQEENDAVAKRKPEEAESEDRGDGQDGHMPAVKGPGSI